MKTIRLFSPSPRVPLWGDTRGNPSCPAAAALPPPQFFRKTQPAKPVLPKAEARALVAWCSRRWRRWRCSGRGIPAARLACTNDAGRACGCRVACLSWSGVVVAYERRYVDPGSLWSHGRASVESRFDHNVVRLVGARPSPLVGYWERWVYVNGSLYRVCCKPIGWAHVPCIRIGHLSLFSAKLVRLLERILKKENNLLVEC
jgi:hypothetical protein